MKFISIRAHQESINNIKYTQIHSIHTTLPFRSRSFDFVIFNGAFEGYKYTDNPKQRNQQFKIFLTELHRLLKKSGHLYIVLRNRLALDHTKLTKIHTAEGKRKLKHNNISCTYWAYRKLFKSCNFKKTKFFIPLNSYLHPNFIFSFDDIYSIQYIMKLKFQFHLNKYLKLIPISTFSFMMNFARYFPSDYIIIAEK
ncbi:MAG: methyltransferase domain-containing protein [Candidatus Hodarchaeota archaeon]